MCADTKAGQKERGLVMKLEEAMKNKSAYWIDSDKRNGGIEDPTKILSNHILMSSHQLLLMLQVLLLLIVMSLFR